MKCPRCGKELRRSKKDPSYGLCDNCRKKFEWEEDFEDYEYEEDYSYNRAKSKSQAKNPKKKKLSKLLLVSLIIGVLYLIYSASYWSGAAGSGTDTAEQIGAGIATALVMPHLVMTVLAVVFNALGLFMHKRGFALTGAILYTVALVLFPIYFMFVIIEMILSYVAFAKMKNQ